MNTFAERLTHCRKLLGLSQTELATKADVPRSLINHYEAGRRQPSVENVRKLRRALHVPFEMLLGN